MSCSNPNSLGSYHFCPRSASGRWSWGTYPSSYACASLCPAPHRLVQRRDEVVVLLTALVVFREALLQGVADNGGGQAVGRWGDPSLFPLPRDVFRPGFHRLQCPPRVAVGFPCEQRQGVVVDRQSQGADSTLSVLQRPAHDGLDVLLGERFQHEHAAA